MRMAKRLVDLRDARVGRRLVRDEDDREDVVDEVHHHIVVYTGPFLELVGVLAVFYVLATSTSQGGVLLLVLALALLGHAAWTALAKFMEVFVITDRRVFRISGVINSTYATTPLKRILDITVHQPLLGLLLRFGHFTFESAAQEQGLRDIRYVSRPLERDKTIQRHLRRSGLSGNVGGDD